MTVWPPAGDPAAVPERVVGELAQALMVASDEGMFGPWRPDAGGGPDTARARVRALLAPLWREAFHAGAAYSMSIDPRPVTVKIEPVDPRGPVGPWDGPGQLWSAAATAAAQQQCPPEYAALVVRGDRENRSPYAVAMQIWRGGFAAGARYGSDLSRSMLALAPELVDGRGRGYAGPDAMTFADMLVHLSTGAAAARAVWSAHTWIVYVPGSTITVDAGRPLGQALPEWVGKTLRYRGHIDLITARGEVAVWHPTIDAITAGDWYLRERPIPAPPISPSPIDVTAGLLGADYWVDGCRCVIEAGGRLELHGCPVHQVAAV